MPDIETRLRLVEARFPPDYCPEAANYKPIKLWFFGRNIRSMDDLKAEFYSRYIYDNGTCDHLNDELERYSDFQNHEIDNEAKVLRITPRGADGGVSSGLLRSKYVRKYGLWVFRLRVVNAAKGVWAAAWLNPEDQKWPPEIDAGELVFNERGRDDNTVVFMGVRGDPNAVIDKQTYSQLDKWGAVRGKVDWAKDFIELAVHWTETGITHYLNGEKIVEREFHWLHDDGSDAGPVHTLVDLAIGGHWPGTPDFYTPAPVLEVESVQIYAPPA
jgi:hypothetical protein